MKATLLFILISFASFNLGASTLEFKEIPAYVVLDNSVDADDKLVIITNPVKDGQLRIKYNLNEGVSFNLSIVNSLGEQVFSAKRNTSRQELSFDIAKLSAGIYFLRVSTDDTSVVKKLIIQ